MSGLITSKKEVSDYLDTANFVAQTCVQINKDLMGTSEIIVHSNKETSENILHNLTTQITVIIKEINSIERLSQFIYRVDLPENDFKQCLTNGNWEKLAFLIIKREAQKVYLKNKFRV